MPDQYPCFPRGAVVFAPPTAQGPLNLESISLPHVLPRRNGAKIRGDVQAAYPLSVQRNDVIDVIGTAGFTLKTASFCVHRGNCGLIRPCRSCACLRGPTFSPMGSLGGNMALTQSPCACVINAGRPFTSTPRTADFPSLSSGLRVLVKLQALFANHGAPPNFALQTSNTSLMRLLECRTTVSGPRRTVISHTPTSAGSSRSGSSVHRMKSPGRSIGFLTPIAIPGAACECQRGGRSSRSRDTSHPRPRSTGRRRAIQ